MGFRIFITPMDAFKTTLQVHGPAGLTLLTERIASEGVLTLWSGALATAFATFAGHYPWFVTNNYLEAKIPAPSKDKVVTTKKQTSKIALSYMATVSTIVAEDGVQGLFLRGLGTKLITNGVSAMLFSILWKYFEQKLSAPAKDAK